MRCAGLGGHHRGDLLQSGLFDSDDGLGTPENSSRAGAAELRMNLLAAQRAVDFEDPRRVVRGQVDFHDFI